MDTRKILVVDDEPEQLRLLQMVLDKAGYQTVTARDGREALKRMAADIPDVVITDLLMPHMNGLELLETVRHRYPEVATLVMTAHPSWDTATEGFKMGITDYLEKPFNLNSIVEKVRELVPLHPVSMAERGSDHLVSFPGFEGMVGTSPRMQTLYRKIRRLAQIDAPILIQGDNGTGKELVADALHAWSRPERRSKPLLKINCASIPESLMESELFGYVKGAFTGANADKAGIFEAADGGTLFLDEIGDISPALQARFLRVLQHMEFSRVGATDTTRINVRVVAATNRDLIEAVRRREFRRDLFYRLNVLPIVVPSLRERPEDIPLLATFIVKRHCRQMNRPEKRISEALMHRLMAYPWVGNIREMENTLLHAVAMSDSAQLEPHDLPAYMELLADDGDGVRPGGDGTFEELMARFERDLILKALQQTGYNRSAASRLLGINRTTLHAKMKKHELESSRDN